MDCANVSPEIIVSRKRLGRSLPRGIVGCARVSHEIIAMANDGVRLGVVH